MANIAIGCDFSDEHISVIKALKTYQERYETPSRMTAVYGSPKYGNPFGSVRPNSRESAIDTEDFANKCRFLKFEGIRIHLAFNSLFPHYKNVGIRLNIFSDTMILESMYKFFEEIDPYVDALIVAHPFLIEWLHKEKFSFNIIVSTIMNVHTLTQVQWIKDNWPQVSMICPALWKNRDFAWLHAAQEILPLELLLNEFCSIGGVECEGLYRQACYSAQSLEVYDYWNPMKTACIESRRKNPESWLMARFILPQWISEYKHMTGVTDFKMTGRTHKASYVGSIGRAYISEKYDGNLLDLWGQLEATLNKDNWDIEQQKATGLYNIPVEKIEHLLPAFHNCNYDKCGVSCIMCKKVVEGILKNEK